MATQLLLLLGAVSLGLAGLGVYGVMRQGLVFSAAGIATGLALSLGLGRLVGGFLHGVSPFDPLTYGAVPAFLALVGLLARGLPARRATRVDPIVTLRCE